MTRSVPLFILALGFPGLARADVGQAGWSTALRRLSDFWFALPDRPALEAGLQSLFPVIWVWLLLLLLLLASGGVLAGRRAALAIAAGAAPTRGARWHALARYGLTAFAPVVLAFLVPVFWALIATPDPAQLQALEIAASPVLVGALAVAFVNCAFTILAAHGRRADRDVARRLPPQIGLVAGFLGIALLLRAGAAPIDPSLRQTLALIAETLAAFVALRATLQQRLTLRQLLRNESQTPDADPPTLPERMTAVLADNWHIVGVGFILVSLLSRFGVFGAEHRVGMVSDLALSLGLAVAAALVVLLAERLHGHILSRMHVTDADSLRDRLALRLGRVLRTGVQIAFALWALSVILRIWGLDPFGRDGGLLRAAVATLLALYALWFIWTLVDAVLDWSAAQAAGRSTRMRTLLPFLRNVAFVLVATLAVMSVLSNLGVNVAPLLAGAGVVGIAIGIGAQKLVGDVITGIFIIFEDSIAVGETVEAAGKNGVVEGLTIRTLRLRDGDGALHSIPFSSITTLKNSSRGYSSYTISVTILHPEDTDRALAEVGRIGHEIADDPAWAASVTGPFSLWGVDQVSPAGVVIKGNIRSQPNAQWALGREINRRVALRFAELGIAQVQTPAAWPGPQPA